MEEFSRFVAVADIGNISRAAETLNISQPALSRTLALMEQRFRTTLFHRRPGGVELTGAGRILYDHASRALGLLRAAEERIDYEGVGGSLSLSICAGDTWGNVVLPNILAAFKSDHPEIDLRLDIIGSEARITGLAAGNYDLSYGITLPRHERIGKVVFTPMIRAAYRVYVARNHPLLDLGRTIAPHDLEPYEWVKHKFEYDHDPAQWTRTNRIYAFSTNTMLSTLEIVRNSVVLMSTSAVFRETFERHGILDAGPDPISAAHVSGMHRLADARLSPAAELFAEYCELKVAEAKSKYRNTS
ncbi:LysR family transcriptional regulator [uncultured Jannaschia sp.]|uniref:LysR family transcriptional regulator n=1 Tax=uncultured Jannaschia sp. TaxID=293347 RepID=UPI002609147A|nr:LysR family transcriptional regulator [uncultured Jannaschia sp.]